MAGTSTKTVVVGIRLPNDIAKKAKFNADKRGITLSNYLSRVIVSTVGRKRTVGGK